MAKNFVQEGKVLTLPVPEGTVSGTPVAIGEIVGVALTDRNSEGTAQVMTEGVFNLSVIAQSWDATNSTYVNNAIAVGDAIYYDDGKLNKNSNGVLFGYALQAVDAGATATISVKIADK